MSRWSDRKPWNKRDLEPEKKPFIIVEDPVTHKSEFVTWIENEEGQQGKKPEIWTTPDKEKARKKCARFYNDEEFKEFARRCKKLFPNLTFYVCYEKWLPEISRLPEIDGVMSRPLGNTNRHAYPEGEAFLEEVDEIMQEAEKETKTVVQSDTQTVNTDKELAEALNPGTSFSTPGNDEGEVLD